MKKTISTFCGLAAALLATSVWAGISTQVDAENGLYLVTASDHADGNVLSAEQVAELGSYKLVKLGAGTLYAKGELKDFTGDIIISNGYLNVSATNALGTADGETFADGGTLVNTMSNYTTNGRSPTFENEKIHLKGTGYANNGALQNKASNVDFCRNVFLDGDALVYTRGCRLDLRSTTLDMGGHDLTVNGGGGELFFVVLKMKNPGNIVMNGGTFEFQTSFTGDTCRGKTLTLNDGASLSMWNCSSWEDYSIVFIKGTTLKTNSGTFKEYGTDNRNVLYGTNTLDDIVTLSIPSNMQIQLIGKVTGKGGFAGTAKGYLQFIPASGVTNDFQGGVSATGTLLNGGPLGGIVVYSNRAIPTDGGAVTLKNAVLWKHTSDTLALPDVVANGCAMITSSVAATTISTAKTLTKTGDGALTVNMPLKILGKTDIQGGTLRFGRQIPAHPAGLNWQYYNGISKKMEAKGIDATGVAYAYKSWPWESWCDASSHNVDLRYKYEGYIRVPGKEGESVTCNWMTSIARLAKVTIGGVVCCNFSDDKNVKDGITVGYARLAMYKPVTLKAGWQKITVDMSNWWDATRGPQANDNKGWAANFAIGVDWQARCVTNTANYAKLLDPGDGSFLVASNNVSDKITCINADNYRPSFGGAVAFAGGTILDLNDYEPYSALAIPSLTGLPTITNGAVKVASTTWTLRGSDLVSGKALAIGANATLQFGEANSVVTITGDAKEWTKALKAGGKSPAAQVAILGDAGATAIQNTFVVDSALAAEGWCLTQNGRSLLLSRTKGTVIILK